MKESNLFKGGRRTRAAASVAVMLSLCLPAMAQAQDAAKVIKYRQSAHFLLGWNIGPIGAMVKGERPFDAGEARMRALRLEQVAPMIAEGYPPGSQAGAPTKAKPEIWDNMDDFRQKVADLEAATTKLAVATETGDVKQVGTALGAVGGACKACHDRYKAD
jgi:cytochrome c556